MIGTALSSFYHRGKPKKIWIVLLLCSATLNITACDFINNKLYPDFRAKKEKTIIEKPRFAKNNAAQNISIEKMRDVAASSSLPNDAANFTVNPIAINNETADTKKINTNTLFSDDLTDPTARFARLETRVQKIADTLAKMSPSITKLVGIESELDLLTFQLEELINKGVYDEVASRQTQMIQEDKIVQKQQELDNVLNTGKTVKPTPKNSSKPMTTGDIIKKMRVGDHSGKTRIVIETSEKTAYKTAFSNDNKTMTISFDKGYLGGNPAKQAQASNLIKSISQNKSGDGTVLTFNLNKATEKLKDFHMKPDSEVSNQRIVIDLKR